MDLNNNPPTSSLPANESPLEESSEQKSLENTALKKFLRSKRFLFLSIATSVLLVFLALFITNTRVGKKIIGKDIVPTLYPLNQITPTKTLLPTATSTPIAEEIEEQIIKDQVRPQIDKLVTINYEISRVKNYNNIWVLLEITNPDAGLANVVLKNENGVWVIKMGPGTFFPKQDLEAIGAPDELIKDANTHTY